MNFHKSYMFVAIISALLFLQGCAGNPINIGASKDFNRSDYDLENPKEVTVSASGFQLLLFIPIAINSRHERAYAAIEAQADDGLISDVQIKESWTYAFVGTVYKTTIMANVYPRKP